MNATAFRDAVATALTDLDPDWSVHPAPVDAVAPPAYLLAWADPWLLPSTYCVDDAFLNVVCVAARMEPEANYPTVEEMIRRARVALAGAGFAYVQTSPPGPFDIAQVTYLAARLRVRASVDHTEE